MNQDRIYLDYNATTPLAPEVLDAIHTTLRDAWGNPSSGHSAGIAAKTVINNARSSIAKMVGAVSEDVVFISGGTVANNMVIYTAVEHFKKWTCENNISNLKRPHIITSMIEHDSVKLVLEQYEKEGKIDVTFIQPSQSGIVEVDDVIASIKPNTCLVTLMLANNEIGTIQPVELISKRIKALDRNLKNINAVPILLHTDAAQAIGKIPVNIADLGVDYLTVVGHKFYGPRIGALVIQNLTHGTPLYPMFFGGGQERNYRPGTENTGMIAGLGMAADLVISNLESYEEHFKTMRDRLESLLEKNFPEKVVFNGKHENSTRIPNTCNVSFLGDGLDGRKVLSNAKYIQASVGAACHHSNKPSEILLSVGIPENVARNAIRISVGRETTEKDIDVVVDDLKRAIEHLQS